MNQATPVLKRIVFRIVTTSAIWLAALSLVAVLIVVLYYQLRPIIERDSASKFITASARDQARREFWAKTESLTPIRLNPVIDKRLVDPNPDHNDYDEEAYLKVATSFAKGQSLDVHIALTYICEVTATPVLGSLNYDLLKVPEFLKTKLNLPQPITEESRNLSSGIVTVADLTYHEPAWPSSLSWSVDTRTPIVVRWDRVITVVVTLLILGITFTSILGEKRSRHGQALGRSGEENFGGAAPSAHLANTLRDTPRKVLEADAQLIRTRADEMFSRSTLLLTAGILMAFVGVSVFFFSLPDPGDQAEPLRYLPRALRPALILLFIEAIAWFLLRQYRALIEDYKYFIRVYLKRANYVAAYDLLASETVTRDSRMAAAVLLHEDLRGVLRSGETTEALEVERLSDRNAVLDLLKGWITPQARSGVSKRSSKKNSNIGGGE